jgi:hypothetical protein
MGLVAEPAARVAVGRGFAFGTSRPDRSCAPRNPSVPRVAQQSARFEQAETKPGTIGSKEAEFSA